MDVVLLPAPLSSAWTPQGQRALARRERRLRAQDLDDTGHLLNKTDASKIQSKQSSDCDAWTVLSHPVYGIHALHYLTSRSILDAATEKIIQLGTDAIFLKFGFPYNLPVFLYFFASTISHSNVLIFINFVPGA